AVASILLIREYLALASALGAGAALAVVALLFIACNVGASALNYDTNVIQQRRVKVVPAVARPGDVCQHSAGGRPSGRVTAGSPDARRACASTRPRVPRTEGSTP